MDRWAGVKIDFVLAGFSDNGVGSTLPFVRQLDRFSSSSSGRRRSSTAAVAAAVVQAAMIIVAVAVAVGVVAAVQRYRTNR